MAAPAVTVETVPWGAAAAALLAPTMDARLLDVLEQQIAEGRASLCLATSDGEPVAAFVVSKRHEDLVLVASGGRLAGVDLTATILPLIEQWTIEAGARRVRIHAGRRGMVEKLRRLGYREIEATFVKEV